jgi:hypothetical protein
MRDCSLYKEFFRRWRLQSLRELLVISLLEVIFFRTTKWQDMARTHNISAIQWRSLERVYRLALAGVKVTLAQRQTSAKTGRQGNLSYGLEYLGDAFRS